MALLVYGCLPSSLFADTITYLDRDREEQTIEATHIGSQQGFEAFERRDGQIALIPGGAIQERVPGDVEPIDTAGMIELLEQRFGENLVRTRVEDPFIVALVLASPIDRSSEARATALVRKAADFMDDVDRVFLRYARSMKFPLRDPKYPLLLVIFESDDDFNQYAEEATGGRGLSAGVIAGFYSGITNWLAIRMSSCDTFEVPLHEAIHLQMYNRVFQRLAPIPKWFDEGIATGFESNGKRIDTNPALINKHFARLSTRLSPGASWERVVKNDAAFTADVLAGEAYTLAWCMHWMLAKQHKEAYQNYVNELSQRPTLGTLEEDERVERFEEAFGVSVAELEKDFDRTLQANLKRQRINLDNDNAPANGRSVQQQALGEVDVQAVRRLELGGQLQVAGSLKNVSPLRTMTFYVTLETTSGVYADWLVEDLAPGRTKPLEKQVANKLAPGAPGGQANSYRVFIRSVPSGSREAEKWKAGDIPGPVGS